MNFQVFFYVPRESLADLFALLVISYRILEICQYWEALAEGRNKTMLQRNLQLILTENDVRKVASSPKTSTLLSIYTQSKDNCITGRANVIVCAVGLRKIPI